MVSFLQFQCLNCGAVDDVIPMGGKGESSWCSQCGFTRRTAQHVSQERQLQQQLLAEDEQLAALLSKNMWLSESQQAQQQQQQEQLPARTAAPASAVVATPGANISISQHYHHYRHVAPPAPALAPVPAPTEVTPIAASTPPPTYIQHLLTSPDPEAALQDYYRHLTQIEEQYHYQQQKQQKQQYPPSPTGSTVSSIQDDHQLQLILLEQHNLAQEAEKLRLSRARQEEQMIMNQFMMETRDDVMSDDEVSWTGGQPMPNLVQQQQQETGAVKVVYPAASGQPWVASGEEDNYGMEDEDSPCVIYYSRVCNANYL